MDSFGNYKLGDNFLGLFKGMTETHKISKNLWICYLAHGDINTWIENLPNDLIEEILNVDMQNEEKTNDTEELIISDFMLSCMFILGAAKKKFNIEVSAGKLQTTAAILRLILGSEKLKRAGFCNFKFPKNSWSVSFPDIEWTEAGEVFKEEFSKKSKSHA